MLTEYQVHALEIAAWLSTAGFVVTAIVAIWLVHRPTRLKLRVRADKWGQPTSREDHPDIVVIEVANAGTTPIGVISVWWMVRYPRSLRRFAPRSGIYQDPPEGNRRSHNTPAVLEPEQTMHWLIDDVGGLIGQMAEKFAPSLLWRLHVRYLRIGVSTSAGVPVRGKVGSALKRDLRAAIVAINSGTRSDR